MAALSTSSSGVLILLLLIILLLSLLAVLQVHAGDSGEEEEKSDVTGIVGAAAAASSSESPSSSTTTFSSRDLAALGARWTSPSPDDRLQIKRKNFPENDPHVCLAFLSCCGRTDLLNHTMAGAIRHMEEDEPDNLRYEIAWVDNASGADSTKLIEETYEIEHALTLPRNMGLAYGMNLLVINLCRAPYILLLEEDWLYLDDVVAKQTPQRKRAIATGIALTETLLAGAGGASSGGDDDTHHRTTKATTSFDGRKILGVFLRPETYETFLHFPHADVWETVHVDLNNIIKTSTTNEDDGSCGEEGNKNTAVPVDYRIFCGDSGLRSESIWGSYTNGAGLYRRDDLVNNIGRMFGEPGDAFHDRYVEGNYAYRVGLKYCHAAIRLTDDETCRSVGNPECTAAFHHIGGGRGTRPMNPQGTKCEDQSWNFYGTLLYDKYLKFKKAMGHPTSLCSEEELNELRDVEFREKDSEAYREETKRLNKETFEKESAERDKLREQALLIEKTDNDILRQQIPGMEELTDEEIATESERMMKLANSPHPLKGFWDSHGRPIEQE